MSLKYLSENSEKQQYARLTNPTFQTMKNLRNTKILTIRTQSFKRKFFLVQNCICQKWEKSLCKRFCALVAISVVRIYIMVPECFYIKTKDTHDPSVKRDRTHEMKRTTANRKAYSSCKYIVLYDLQGLRKEHGQTDMLVAWLDRAEPAWISSQIWRIDPTAMGFSASISSSDDDDDDHHPNTGDLWAGG